MNCPGTLLKLLLHSAHPALKPATKVSNYQEEPERATPATIPASECL